MSVVYWVHYMAKGYATRRYQLTINNPQEHGYDHNVIKAALEKGAKLLYWCMADEVGQEETYHIHLFLVYENPVMFTTLKNKFPTAHIEVPQWGKNSENYAYIRKEGAKYTFHNGLRRIQTDSKTAQQYVLLCLALAVAALIMVSGGSGEDVISVVFRPFVNFIRVIAWLAECLGVIYLFGYIPHSWSYYDDFSRAGICNQAHEAPLLVKANRDGNIQQLTFSLKGCPLEYWEDNRTTIESALNVTVLSITQGSNNQLFDLRVVAGCNLMGRLIPWADTYMDDSGTKIVLGINAAGIPVSIDFSQLPHWLLAAATGMGKTQLALLILYQLSQKGYDIYLADYKGVDFGPEYRKTGHYADDDAALEQMLDSVVHELNHRRTEFSIAGCANLEEYVQTTGEELHRIVVILDETSMILDTTGRDKDGKAVVASITNKLLAIGRLGRALGIHLLVATQRPDVGSVPGSLKAQLDGRICGHTADAQSSIVILDDGSAAKLPAIPGRFIIRNGSGSDEIIQAYYYHQ